MHWSVNLMLVAGLWGAEASVPQDVPVFDSYTKAYKTAQETHRPLLVILNPNSTDGVEVEDVTRSQHRRDLLKKYVVVSLDATTPHGQTMHKLFGAEKALPRVVVIDKQQQWQIYRTSESLSSEQWNLLLENFQNGVAPVRNTVSYCPYCR